MDRRYTCSACKEVFEYSPEDEWSDQDALAEAEKLFGSSAGPMVIVCDDCFNKMGLAHGRN